MQDSRDCFIYTLASCSSVTRPTRSWTLERPALVLVDTVLGSPKSPPKLKGGCACHDARQANFAGHDASVSGNTRQSTEAVQTGSHTWPLAPLQKASWDREPAEERPWRAQKQSTTMRASYLLHETAQLGAGHPLFLLVLPVAAGPAPAPATVAPATVTTTPASKASVKTSTVPATIAHACQTHSNPQECALGLL